LSSPVRHCCRARLGVPSHCCKEMNRRRGPLVRRIRPAGPRRAFARPSAPGSGVTVVRRFVRKVDNRTPTTVKPRGPSASRTGSGGSGPAERPMFQRPRPTTTESRLSSFANQLCDRHCDRSRPPPDPLPLAALVNVWQWCPTGRRPPRPMPAAEVRALAERITRGASPVRHPTAARGQRNAPAPRGMPFGFLHRPPVATFALLPAPRRAHGPRRPLS